MPPMGSQPLFHSPDTLLRDLKPLVTNRGRNAQCIADHSKPIESLMAALRGGLRNRMIGEQKAPSIGSITGPAWYAGEKCPQRRSETIGEDNCQVEAACAQC